ncbi:MAG: polysaccharide deacetylase family protein [Bacteroidota bacterium]|nr:polysaccharide deacetylase family protein [Bacteroidota bacterium]
MKSRLTAIQLDYVLDHIGHHAELDEELRLLISYGEKPDPGNPSVCFPASDNELSLKKVIRIDGIPVLYPIDKIHDTFYSIGEKSLVFHHDLLKSIFHLLSGYEEFKSGAADQYGRFPYTESLQFNLGIIDKPVVNYYMEIILTGLRQFCKKNGIPFQDKTVFQGPILMLSHDVDLIDAYDFKETAYKFKQLLGLADSPFKLKGRIRDAFTALYHFLNPFSKCNPFWTFNKLMEWESERGFLSTYFFLEKDGKYDNSRYSFNHKKIRKLIGDLLVRGHEIGIHGTMQSFDNPQAMQRTVEHLRAVSSKPVTGIRQHYLRFAPGITAPIQAEAGLVYDASLGYAEFDGFRNSYCWPYKFFDFDQNRAMDYWEIPLTLMDVTHFYYRNLNLSQSKKAIEDLAAEVLKFNGVFSLLWHNSFFNEWEIPGISKHYTDILDHLKTLGMEGITGMEIINRIKKAEGR